MPQTLIRYFDRLQWLERMMLLQRSILFLDLNFWISLAEQTDGIYVELIRLLHEMVEAGQLVCPVSPSLLMELRKRPSSEKRDCYCQLMDCLSQGLSLRIGPVVFENEFGRLVEGKQVERQIAYSHFLDAFSSGSHLVFPEGWAPEFADQAANLVFDHLEAMSIREFMNAETEEFREQNIGYLRNGWRELCRQEEEWRRQDGEISLAEIERAEFAATVRSLIPQIWQVVTKASTSRLLKPISTSLAEKRGILEACPTFWCRYRLISALRSNRSKVEVNDLWDFEHVVSAVPYVDCLACDSGTRHICTQMVKLDQKYDMKIVSKPDELLEWVRSLRAT